MAGFASGYKGIYEESTEKPTEAEYAAVRRHATDDHRSNAEVMPYALDGRCSPDHRSAGRCERPRHWMTRRQGRGDAGEARSDSFTTVGALRVG